MAVVTVTADGRIPVPEDIRKGLALKDRDVLAYQIENGRLEIRKTTSASEASDAPAASGLSGQGRRSSYARSDR